MIFTGKDALATKQELVCLMESLEQFGALQPGDTVEENQVLMTIEAMKMETAVTARTAGKVREIRVKEGQAVKAKELLMLLD